MQEMTRLQDSESGMDSPRADSELDLASEFSVPDLFQVLLPHMISADFVA